MKTYGLFPPLVFAALVWSRTVAANPQYGVALTVYYEAPSIRAYLSDGTDADSGTDPNFSLDATGQQWNGGIYHSIHQIFNSSVVQKFLDGGSSTLWEVDLERPSGVYVLNYSTNLPSNYGDIRISFLNGTAKNRPVEEKLVLLAQRGIYRQVKIRVSAGPSLSIAPLTSGGNLLKDTQFACTRGDIGPEEMRRLVIGMASKILNFSDSGAIQAEAVELKIYLRALERLHRWGEKGVRGNWDDLRSGPEYAAPAGSAPGERRFFVNDPAYHALKLDADALLGALPGSKPPTGGNR